jgi:hypothetical protein
MIGIVRARLPEPERWTSRPPGGSSAQDRLAAALRTAAEVTLQPPARTAAAAWVTSPGITRRRRRSLVLAALVVGLGGVGWATMGGQQVGPPPAGPTETIELVPPAAPAPTPAPAPAAVAPAGPVPPAVSPSVPVTPEIPAIRRPVPASRSAKATQPAPVAPSAAPSEVSLLAQAYRHLRVDRDAGAALKRLDEYAVHFPAGALRLEAEVARVEALLMLGRRPEALRTLDALPPRIAGPVRQRLQL